MTQSTARVMAPNAALTCRGMPGAGRRASKANAASWEMGSLSTVWLNALTDSWEANSGNSYSLVWIGEDMGDRGDVAWEMGDHQFSSWAGNEWSA
jgi:hypothetical protein